jgi:predicted TPR repeat methyltransferase
MLSGMVVRLIGPPEADGEYIALRGDGPDDEIVHLHDYPRIYGVPGLYEYVVGERLACRSPQVAVDGLANALAQLGRDPAQTVLLDLGAGTGLVGELAKDMGVATVFGLDSLSEAQAACRRDRPTIYTDYLVGDLAAAPPALLARMRRHRPTAIISAGAFGGSHAPPAALITALALVPTGAPVVFTIDERWMRTDAPGGFRAAVAQLFDSGDLRLLRRTRFQHRLSTTGEPIHYELVVAFKGS